MRAPVSAAAISRRGGDLKVWGLSVSHTDRMRSADDALGQAAPHGLYFGQFGHGSASLTGGGRAAGRPGGANGKDCPQPTGQGNIRGYTARLKGIRHPVQSLNAYLRTSV